MTGSEQTEWRAILEAAHDKKAQDVVVFGIEKLSIMADYVMLASGTSTTHVGAIAAAIKDKAEELGLPIRSEGLTEAKWALLDLGSVIVHVMTNEIRKFYALEELWARAEVVYRDEPTEQPPV
jgi:ribosome-associated protein